MTERLRVAVVLPGAVSLGAYEAGAVTGLVRAVRASGGRIVVDTIVGASAGSVTGLLLAHALIAGPQSDADIAEFWVRQASIGELLKSRRRSGQARGPLSTERLERWAERVLRAPAPAAAEPIAFVATLANLRGVRYGIAQARGRTVEADTFRDAKAFLLSTPEDCLAAIPAAVASAAHAFAFPPILLHRSKDEYPPNVKLDEDEAARGFWYTDGGTVYNQPLGFALEAAFNPEELRLERPVSDDPRLVLLVHPNPSAPPHAWPPDQALPNFVRTGIRALNMSREQSMFDDLRRLEKTNNRIRARDALMRKLDALLDTPAGAPLAQAIRDLDSERRGRHQAIAAQVGAPPPDEPPPDVRAELDAVLHEIAGTRGKRIADVHVVSPDLDPLKRHPAELLAGERLGHFFGFALRGARESDFGLGFHHFRLWWSDLRGRAAQDVAEALPVVKLGRHPLETEGDARGALGPWDLPRWRTVLWSARLGWRYASEALGYLRMARRRPPSAGSTP